MPIQSSSLVRSDSLKQEWRQYGRFMRWPVLPRAASGFTPSALRDVLRLYVLDIALMVALVTIGLLIVAIGFEFPENALAGIDWNIGWVLLIVLGAPLYEEVAFRSWLSGRPHHLAALGAFIGGAFLTSVVAGAFGFGEGDAAHGAAMIGVMALVVGLVLAAITWWRIPARPPFRWFKRFFPLLFALSSLGFAAIHLANYEEGALRYLLPLIVPQLIAGTIFGYARVTYGFWAAVLLHTLHNSTAMLVILVTSGLAG